MDNRSKILACALQLFATRGYDAVGVQEIVAAVGIAKPTLYHFFGSKEGVLQALLAEQFTAEYELVKQAAVYHGDLPLTLTRIAAAYFQFAGDRQLFYRLQLSLWFAPASSVAHKAVARLNETQQQVIEEVFVRAVKEHGNLRGRHRAYAATFLGMINTYIGLALNGYTDLTDEVLYQAVHQFMHGIFS
jgi:AcrR family transcriptional regulator